MKRFVKGYNNTTAMSRQSLDVTLALAATQIIILHSLAEGPPRDGLRAQTMPYM